MFVIYLLMVGVFFCSGVFFSIYILIHPILSSLGLNLFSVSLLCIITGVLINNTINLPDTFSSGIQFCKKNLLQLGIVLLGSRLSFYEVGSFGLMAIPFVLITFVTVAIFTYLLIKIFLDNKNTIMLISIGTAICGITAILACAPFTKAKDNEIAYATFVISIIGTIALLSYPYISYELFNNYANQVGIFLGTSIHDTGQVIASSFIYNSHYENSDVITISTVTKLLRNSFLIILIPALAWRYSDSGKFNYYYNIKNSFPLFVIGFLFFSVMRSLGDYVFFSMQSMEAWNSVLQINNFLSFILLNIALVALGLSVNLKSLKIIGLKPLFIGLTLSIIILIVNVYSIKIFLN